MQCKNLYDSVNCTHQDQALHSHTYSYPPSFSDLHALGFIRHGSRRDVTFSPIIARVMVSVCMQSNLGADPFNSGYAPMREGLGSGMAPPTPSPQVPSQRTAGIYESVRHDNASTPSGEGTWTSSAANQSKLQGIAPTQYPSSIQTGRPADSGFGSQGTYTSQAIQQAAGEEDRLQRDYPGKPWAFIINGRLPTTRALFGLSRPSTSTASIRS